MAVLAVLLAPALRTYVAQRQQIRSMEQRVAQQRRQVSQLERDRAAWRDPAYVRAQARERLKFVLPGERVFTVLDPQVGSAPAPATSLSPVSGVVGTTGSDRSWFGDIWRSTEVAGGTSP